LDAEVVDFCASHSDASLIEDLAAARKKIKELEETIAEVNRE
jgi:hypothetical protein